MRIIFFLMLPPLALALAAMENAPREFRAARGEAAVTVLSEEAPIPAGDSADTAQAVPIASIEDFTSLQQSVPSGEALLELYYLDYATGKELRFPLKYSELRRYLALHPIAYLDADRGERNVALIQDLSEDLRIRMKALQDNNKGGKGK
jgi:hypothetical protein